MPADDAAPPELHRRRIEAAAPSLGPDTVFSHTSAAVIHGLPLLTRSHGLVEVVRTSGAHGGLTRMLRAHQSTIPDDDLDEVDGFRVTSLARTVSDLVRTLHFAEAVMVADAGLARELSREDLLARTAKGRGCRMAARALEFADPRAESPGESLSRVKIQQAGLPAPDLQKTFRDRFGHVFARVDFWWESLGLVGEFDGAVKYEAFVKDGQTAKNVVMAEKRREQALRDAGFEVVRWAWDDLWQHRLEHRLRAAIARRSRTNGAETCP